MFPEKLKRGDEIRVVAPSRSLGIISEDVRKLAIERLEALGLKVTFGRHVEEENRFHSSAVESRLTDLHEAFEDADVKGILTVIGGHNSNQLLRDLDYEVIRANPKVLCGYSDITALSNAILAKTGLVTYSGPHFSSFGMKKGLDYTLDYFERCLMKNDAFKVEASESWSDDPWYMDQENRNFVPNEGYHVISKGKAEGRIIGGNLCTLNLLQGTGFMPDLKGAVLFLEDDFLVDAGTFDRDLQSLLHLPEAEGIRGIVIGRFQKKSEMTPVDVAAVIGSKPELDDIPVIYGADFGHTTPHLTFPVGGTVRFKAIGEAVSLEIMEH
ncbi:S66 family peptidase [Alteribacter natronophilus]|uniref:S66 family peptidase n=1 Tax=Alteribacter natronophilus TaxID=2583810 RepID=UPI00110E37BF|nr:S66 peptidase family protein [Alteribacter natronophilus]TMW70470.1 LD-carboxypeptidase [Alteribacter natronophilus]